LGSALSEALNRSLFFVKTHGVHAMGFGCEPDICSAGRATTLTRWILHQFLAKLPGSK